MIVSVSQNSIGNSSIDTHAIQAFMMRFRSEDRVYIPDEKIQELIDIVKVNMKISLNLRNNNPLSTMETLTLALSLLVAPRRIAEILMSTHSTVETYIKRAKLKLGADSKSLAIFESMRRGYFKILN